MGLLLQDKETPRETFLQKFYKVRRMNACLFICLLEADHER